MADYQGPYSGAQVDAALKAATELQPKVTEIDGKLTELSQDTDNIISNKVLEDFTAGYINTNKTEGTVIDLSPIEHDTYVHVIIDVVEGERYTIYGMGGYNPLLWAVLGADNAVIVKSEKELDARQEGAEVIIPIGGKTLVCNVNKKYKVLVSTNRISKNVAAHSVVLNTILQQAHDTEELLNDHLLQFNNEVYQSVQMEDGYIWDTRGTVGTVFDYVHSKLANYESVMIPCSEGDRFIINATGSNWSAKPYTFIDANDIILSNSGSLAEYFGIVVAPANSAYIIINNNSKTLKSYPLGSHLVNDNYANLLKLNSELLNTDALRPYQSQDGSFTSFNLELIDVTDADNRIVTAYAKYEGEAPTIQFLIGDIYTSTSYIIGGNGRFELKQWRIPPALQSESVTIKVKVPTGTSLMIDSFSCLRDNTHYHVEGGIRLDSHLGFQSVAPENTMIAFELAAKCGYPACIVNPIRSADGTWYCYHEDDATLTQDGVTFLSLSASQFSSLTDAQLAEYRVAGLRNQRNYYSEPIPTLEEFFKLCAKTGMKPMFSTHPGPTEEGWQEIKAMLDKYNLRSKITVKAFAVSILESAYAALGDTDGYIYDVNDIDVEAYSNALDNSALRNYTGRKGIEYVASEITQEIAIATRERGYIVSAWSLGNMKGERYYELISFGVTEFTDDNNGSAGLNW